MLAVLNALVSLWPSVQNVFLISWPYVLRYWKMILIAVLLAVNILSYNEWQHTADLLKTEKATHAADIKAYKDAQAQAEAKAAEIKKALLEESKAKADEADRNYTTLYSMYRTNLLRYQALAGTRSGPSGDSHSGTSEVLDGPGSSTLVPVTTEDLNICAINTARLQSAHEWALNLKEMK